MADFVDFRVWGAPPDALAYAQQALAGDGFRVTARTEWTCLVEKGSSVNRALAGGLVERSILKLPVFDGGPGAALLRLEKQASGWSGGSSAPIGRGRPSRRRPSASVGRSRARGACSSDHLEGPDPRPGSGRGLPALAGLLEHDRRQRPGLNGTRGV